MSDTEKSSSTSPATRHLKWLLPVMFLIVAGGGFYLLKSTKPQAPSKPVTEKVWSVQTQPVTFQSLSPEIILYGQVESPQLTQLSSAVTAFVDAVPAREGIAVSKGDLLIQLDSRDAQLVVQQRQADLHSIQAKIDAANIQHASDQAALKIEQNLYSLAAKTVSRYQDLVKRKVGSEDQLDNARRSYQQQALSLNNRKQAITSFPAQLAQLEAEKSRISSLLATAKLDLERTQIVAPYDARVASIAIASGDRVRSGDPLLSLYNPKTLQVRSQIPSRILPQIRQGLSGEQGLMAQANIDATPVTLRLSRLASEVDKGKSGVDALFEIEDGKIAPEPGRTLSLTLTLPAQDNIIAIPPLALYGTDRVYRVNDGKLEAVTVNRVGDTRATNNQPWVLVTSEQLSEDDKIITTQLPNAITGLPVKAME